ncbi:hypothetical protein MMC17_006605 [Xylographa soralifera]|nr:hypothetical protein [Xylographa soralifera]
MTDPHVDVNEYSNLDEISAPPPVQNRINDSSWSCNTLEETCGPHPKSQDSGDDSKKDNTEVAKRPVDKEAIPEEYANLNELLGPAPIENPAENRTYRHCDLEEAREEYQQIEHDRQSNRQGRGDPLPQPDNQPPTSNVSGTVSARRRISAYLAKTVVPSYLILFSILGTLARLGMQALTTYPEAPIAFPELWANVGGCLIMGYLSEDRMFFQEQWHTAMKSVCQTEKGLRGNRNGATDGIAHRLSAVKKAHTAAKKSLPVYIGLTVGFCGSFTSFSSFIRDVFLALSNDLVAAESGDTGASQVAANNTRNAGYSVMAVIAIIVIEGSLCFSTLSFGAQLAIILESASHRLPSIHIRKFFNPFIVVIAWTAWALVTILCIWPPNPATSTAGDRHTAWMQTMFALVFAPVGCLARFYASLRLNGLIARFPLGTFVVNMLGVAVLGMCWDLQRAPSINSVIGGGQIGCQVLQGIQDGFCGCLTTVSTWILELKGLRRKDSYFYGTVSVSLGLVLLVVIMGTFKWTEEFVQPACST